MHEQFRVWDVVVGRVRGGAGDCRRQGSQSVSQRALGSPELISSRAGATNRPEEAAAAAAAVIM